jgi:multidrug efflux pump subunit AcrA (membrane-fusion protein)
MYPVRIFIASACVCAALLSSACNNTEIATPDAEVESARPAKIVPVLSDGISVLRTFPGTLEATQKADLAFRVGGQLKELPAQAGLAVKEGDRLARLDESDFQNTVKERQARYDLAKVKHDQISKLKEK